MRSATTCCGGRRREQLEQVASAGIGGVGVAVEWVDVLGVAALEALLDEYGLVATSLMSCSDLTPEARMVELLDAAAVLGAPGLLAFTVPRDEDGPAADERTRAWLRPLAQHAADRGVLVMFEPFNPMLSRMGRMHTVRHALDLIDDLPGAGVVVDTTHVYWDRFVWDDLAGKADRIGTVQLSNVPTEAIDSYRYDRCELGAEGGELPLASMIARLEALGYRGAYENEVLTRIRSSERPAMLRRDREWFEAL